jgi:hypothetical protein
VAADYYSVLGVSPAAEDVVIGAAYRALIRHYHPDTNPDPKAQQRAREITEAYNVLRDPASRARYDAARGVDLWDEEDDPRPPPPMRAVGIGATLLAVAGAAAVWFWPRDAAQPPQAPVSPPKLTAHEPSPEPIVALRPEADRLADLGRATAPRPPVAEPEAPSDVPIAEPPLLPVRAARDQPPAPLRKPVAVVSAGPGRISPKAPAVLPPPAVQPSAAPRASDRAATLARMSSGFFTQSMANATDQKRALLVAARDRSAAQRKVCRTDSCVADAYVRQIRETSAIMEGKTAPKD